MRKPTQQQAEALQLIKEGVIPTKAMKQAGYSDKTSEAPGQNLLRSAAAKGIIEQYKAEYLKVGITPQYMAQKTAEWLEAKKAVSARITGKDADSQTDDFIDVPDYQTQLKAAEMVRKDWKMGEEEFSEEASFVWRKK